MSKAHRASTIVSRLVPRRNRAIAILVTTAVAAMLLSGCVPSGSSGNGTATGDTNLYHGDIPAPAAIPESPHLPPFPRNAAGTDPASVQAYNAALTAYSAAFQASKAKVTAQAAAIKKLVAETQKGGETAVAAWESLLVTAGIAVLGANGKPVSLHGDTGSGWAMTDAELRLHSALSASAGGLRLTDFADTLSTSFKMSKDDLAKLLYNELYSIPDRDFAAVFDAVGPRLYDKTKMVPVADVLLNWAQVELIMRRLATEIAVTGSRNGDMETSGYRTDPSSAPSIVTASYTSQQGKHRDCENAEGPWSKAILDQTMKAHSQFVFDGIIGHLEDLAAEASETGTEAIATAGHIIGWARLLMAAASLYAKATALQASFDMPNSPLVRTKDRRIGEIRDLNITYTFNPGKWETVRECLNLFLSPIGIELPGSSPDAPSDMDVQISSDDPSILRIGDGTGKSKKVNIDETDKDGKASFKISGAPQGDRIPNSATPDDLTVVVRASNDLTSADFFKDVQSVGWDAADAAGSFGLSLVPQLIARSKFITFRYAVPVRDWKLSADFQVTAIGDITEQRAFNIEYTGCGITTRLDRSTKGLGTFASDPVNVTAKLLSNPDAFLDNQAFVFVPKGEDFELRDAGEGDGVYMFPLPVHYKTEKSYSEPGSWSKKPDVFVDRATVCAGGGAEDSGYTPVDDCGVRDYDGVLQATMPKARHLYLAGTAAGGSDLWKHCGDPLRPTDAPVAPAIGYCVNSKVAGGKVPSIADIYDTSKKRFSVEGTLSCTEKGDGSIGEVDYNWTMQFCRIENGKPDC
jgi:hypothetical protein